MAKLSVSRPQITFGEIPSYQQDLLYLPTKSKLVLLFFLPLWGLSPGWSPNKTRVNHAFWDFFTTVTKCNHWGPSPSPCQVLLATFKCLSQQTSNRGPSQAAKRQFCNNFRITSVNSKTVFFSQFWCFSELFSLLLFHCPPELLLKNIF